LQLVLDLKIHRRGGGVQSAIVGFEQEVEPARVIARHVGAESSSSRAALPCVAVGIEETPLGAVAAVTPVEGQITARFAGRGVSWRDNQMLHSVQQTVVRG
jgi:hypothetical protein